MKSLRQIAILEIIKEHDIETQEQLANALREHGIVTTQATVSRDIKEMRLAKVLARSGAYKYAVPDTIETDQHDRLTRILADSVLSMSVSGSLVVVHTLSAAAGAAAEVLDALHWPEVLGTVAGDNTVFMAIREDVDAHDVMARINDLIK